MGVSQLWAQLEPAHSVTTWNQLADLHFRNSPGTRGLRLGVDMSLWLKHIEKMRELETAEGEKIHAGANADLRTIFFRVCALLRQGILAVFVFDGPNRPRFKRNKEVGVTAYAKHHKVLKEMLPMMGMEWRIADGEAEAELADMAMRGEIDAVLSDDVDSFLFGAPMVIRNTSKDLTGNKSKVALARRATLPDPDSSPMKPTSSFQSTSSTANLDLVGQYEDVNPSHAKAICTFSLRDIQSTTGFNRDDLILIALLAGGDYSTHGLEGCGMTTAKRLAEAGYGRKLLDGIKRLKSNPTEQERFIGEWKEEVAEVFINNHNKILERKNPKLAQTLLEKSSWPNLDIVRDYLHPRVSNPSSRPPLLWDNDINLKELIPLVSRLFEWGNEQVVAKLRNGLWLAIAMRQFRRTALEQDRNGTSSSSHHLLSRHHLVENVSQFECGPSTEFTASYRLQLDSNSFDRLISPCLPRPDPHPFEPYETYSPERLERYRFERQAHGRAQERPKEPTTTDFRHWVPVGFVERDAEVREKVKEWKDEKDRKARAKEEADQRKAERARAKAEGRTVKSSPVKIGATRSKPTGTKKKSRSKSMKGSDDEDSDGVEEEDEKEVRKALAVNKRDKQAAMRQAILDRVKGKGKEAIKETTAPTTNLRSTSSRSSGLSTSSTIFASSPPSSDLEFIPPQATTSRLRKPKATSPAANLLNSFASSKTSTTNPSTSSFLTGSKRFSSPPSFQPSIFSSSKPNFESTKTKRSLANSSPPPFFGDNSIDDDDNFFGSTRDAVTSHVDKTSRTLKSHTSPSKVRKKQEVIELLSSSEEEEAGYSSRRTEGTGSGGSQGSNPSSGSSQATVRGKMVERTRPGESGMTASSTSRVEMLVLSDSD